MNEHKYFCADFETNATPDSILENPVWLWAFAPVGARKENQVKTGNSIESFLTYVFSQSIQDANTDDYTVFFHNLKFDGNFIIPQLFVEGYEYTEKISKRIASRIPKTFTCLRSANGAFYTITVCITKEHTITFRDSLKIITGSIKSMPKLFGFESEMGKLSFSEEDYTRIRPKGYEASSYELKYCKYDVLVLCRALQILYESGFDFKCLTTGAFAWQSVCENLLESAGSDEKKNVNVSNFKSRMFSISEQEWMFAREAYYGGITVVNPLYKGKLLNKAGRTDDVNSMYPTVMRYYNLPYGKGKYVKGCPLGLEYTSKNGNKIRSVNNQTLWIARLKCHMELKPNFVPIFTPKSYNPDNPFVRLWKQGERVVSTRERSKEPIEIVITSVDYENLSKHYYFEEVTWVESYLYRSRNDLFKKHVDKYTEMKIQSKKHGLKGQTYVAKLCLNSAYGKLGQRNYTDVITPFIASSGELKWENDVDITSTIFKKGRPMHMAAFITAWARWILCEHIRDVSYERFCYADTDSVHYLGTEPPANTVIDSTKLGAWDNESIWACAKFIRPKAYYEIFENGISNIKLAGCPANLLYNISENGNLDFKSPKVSIDDFEIGLTLEGKKRPVIVPRGVYLENVNYTFKENQSWGEH